MDEATKQLLSKLTEKEWRRVGREMGWFEKCPQTCEASLKNTLDEVDADINTLQRTAHIKNAAELHPELIVQVKARFEEMGFRVSGLPPGEWSMGVETDDPDGQSPHGFRRLF